MLRMGLDQDYYKAKGNIEHGVNGRLHLGKYFASCQHQQLPFHSLLQRLIQLLYLCRPLREPHKTVSDVPWRRNGSPIRLLGNRWENDAEFRYSPYLPQLRPAAAVDRQCRHTGRRQLLEDSSSYSRYYSSLIHKIVGQ
jgi:hypothetical protein